MTAMPPAVTEASVVFGSGFVWDIELLRGERIGETPVLALRDAFRAVGHSHAGQTAVSGVQREFARLGELLMRMKPEFVAANGCTLPLSPLGVSSAALAQLHLSAWPALQAELEGRGVLAEGPAQAGIERREVGPSGREQAPLLRCRLFFDAALVGPTDAFMWTKKPAQTAVELGVASAAGVTVAGIDYAASNGQAIRSWSAVVARPEDALDAGGQLASIPLSGPD